MSCDGWGERDWERFGWKVLSPPPCLVSWPPGRAVVEVCGNCFLFLGRSPVPCSKVNLIRTASLPHPPPRPAPHVVPLVALPRSTLGAAGFVRRSRNLFCSRREMTHNRPDAAEVLVYLDVPPSAATLQHRRPWRQRARWWHQQTAGWRLAQTFFLVRGPSQLVNA